jgi:ribosome-binding protein aMBF1 (putative translation factor)
MLNVKKKPAENSVELTLPQGAFLIMEVDGVTYSVGFGKNRHVKKVEEPSAFDQRDAVAEPENIGTVRLVKDAAPKKKTYGAPKGSAASRKLGKVVREARDASGMEMSEFAEKGQLSASAVYAMENGQFVHISEIRKRALKAWGIRLPAKNSTLWP